MQIAQLVAGYSLGQADLLRKAMGKKNAEIMAAERVKFVTGAAAQGYEERKANEIFDYIEPFARYGFNKSHSVAYALVAYQTAWLKVHHPRHFMAALMSSEMDKTDSMVKFIHEASAMGIKVLPPDVNESNMFFTVVGPNIRFGLGAVKGVGEGAVESILEARRRAGRFSTLLGFCEEVDLRGCNKKVLEALIKSGSFDFVDTTRKATFEALESTVDAAQRGKNEKERGQGSLFGFGGGVQAASLPDARSDARRASAPQAEEWPEEEKLRYEKETLGFYVSGHPLNRFTEELTLFADANTETLHRRVDDTVHIGGIVSQMKKSKIKKGQNEGKLMAKFMLDDQYGSVEVVVFSDLYAKYMRWLDNGVAILVTANVRDTGGMSGNRSASLQSAERAAQHIDDEYGGHPESSRDRVSAYEVRDDFSGPGEPEEADRDPKELEREKYGADVDKFTPSLFGSTPGVAAEPADAEADPDVEAPMPAADGTDVFNDAAVGPDAGDPAASPAFAAHAAAFHEAPVTPELNALEIVPLEGIREKKVKEISLEVTYARMSEETIKKIREIVEEHAGETPLSVTLVDVPESLANSRGQLRMKIAHHFRVQPGADLTSALERVNAKATYLF